MNNFNELNREQLLEEAIEIIRYGDNLLGDAPVERDIDDLKAQAVQLLEGLKDEKASFAPKPSGIYHLTQKSLVDNKAGLSQEIKAKLKNHNFYKMDIPITLTSGTGWAFTSLTCKIIFCPEEETYNVRNLPVIHDMVPTDEWEDILKINESLDIGIDHDLLFRTEVEDMDGQWKSLKGTGRGKLSFKSGSGAKLAFGPFSYSIRRAKIKSRGRGNAKAYWELNDARYVEENDLILGVILMVPKSRTQPVNVIGAMEASHDFQILSADIFKGVRQYFSDSLRQLFNKGIPVKTTLAWEDIIGFI